MMKMVESEPEEDGSDVGESKEAKSLVVVLKWVLVNQKYG